MTGLSPEDREKITPLMVAKSTAEAIMQASLDGPQDFESLRGDIEIARLYALVSIAESLHGLEAAFGKFTLDGNGRLRINSLTIPN